MHIEKDNKRFKYPNSSSDYATTWLGRPNLNCTMFRGSFYTVFIRYLKKTYIKTLLLFSIIRIWPGDVQLRLCKRYEITIT